MGEIHTLASNGNLKGIKKALSNKRIMLSLDDELGWSPLHYAANCSKAKIVQVSTSNNINPVCKTELFETYLPLCSFLDIRSFLLFALVESDSTVAASLLDAFTFRLII